MVLQDVALSLAARLVNLKINLKSGQKKISNASPHLITILAEEVLGGFQDGQVQLRNSSGRNFWVSLCQVVH